MSVDGKTVTELGTRVDPARSVVRVDGKRVVTDTDLVYLALNKPAGVVTAMSDPQGRRTIGDLVRGRGQGLFHVGRLDAETEGLLLVTNDGDLGHRIAHPSFALQKTYLAQVSGRFSKSAVGRLREGVMLDDGPARADRVRIVESVGRGTLVEIVLHEGRNRIVRRMLDAVGNPVERLVRTTVGPVRLANLRPGQVRPLNPEEIAELLDLLDQAASR